ncbi:hypothetical protein [Streptomyces californicus]|uniref:hypothetical protein n=1 Tax=Streptomyces californicus TaxID=67351 RepID=UPI00371F45DD
MLTSLTPGAGPEGAAPPGSPLAVPAGHMPLIALTSGERGLYVPPLTTTPDGWVRYRDPSPFDRYPGFDVLLMRTVGSPSGHPIGAQVSPYRQARCMVELACQSCGRPSARNPAGPANGHGQRLFVLPRHRADGSPSPVEGRTDMPPSCAACARLWCPLLQRQGRQLVWAARAELVGVYGALFVPGQPVRVEQFVPFDEGDQDGEESAGGRGGEGPGPGALSAVVAERFVRDLQEVTPADPAVIRYLAARENRAPAALSRTAGCPGRP